MSVRAGCVCMRVRACMGACVRACVRVFVRVDELGREATCQCGPGPDRGIFQLRAQAAVTTGRLPVHAGAQASRLTAQAQSFKVVTSNQHLNDYPLDQSATPHRGNPEKIKSRK